MHGNEAIRFILENREVLITFIIALVAVIKLTAWGKAQSTALDAVVGIIETLGAREVKRAISSIEGELADGAQDAIRDSVAKADPKKKETNLFLRVVREVFRGI